MTSVVLRTASEDGDLGACLRHRVRGLRPTLLRIVALRALAGSRTLTTDRS